MDTHTIPEQNAVIQALLQALKNLEYGSIEIVVHNGAVTQIERREKFRLAK